MELWELAAREQVRHTISSYTFGGDRGRLDDSPPPSRSTACSRSRPTTCRRAATRSSIVCHASWRWTATPTTCTTTSPNIPIGDPVGHRGLELLPRHHGHRCRPLGPVPRPVFAGRGPLAHRPPPGHDRRLRRRLGLPPVGIRTASGPLRLKQDLRVADSRWVQCPTCGFPIQTLDLPCPQCEAGWAELDGPRRGTSTPSRFAPAGRSGQTRIASWSCSTDGCAINPA